VTTGASSLPDAGVGGFAGSRGRWASRLSRFGRVTSSGRFIPEVDGLRFVAIASVVLYHLSGYVQSKATTPFAADPQQTLLSRVVVHGNIGVQLFFVISGFILAMPFASHYLRDAPRVSLRSYFMRRLTRLEPPYVVSMLLFFVLLVVYVGNSAADLLPHLLASLVYLHNLIFGYASTINGVAWSLEVEVQFYILVPILARVFAIRAEGARRGTIAAAIAAIIAFQWVFIGPHETGRLALSIVNQLQFFLIGFLLADLFVTDWAGAPRRIWQWDVVSLFGWPAIALTWQSEALFRTTFPPLVLMLYIAAFRGVWSSRVFSNAWLTTIGGMCYTIYLLHYQIISFVGRHTRALRISDRFEVEFLWQLALVTPPLLIVCGVYFMLIEKPCMRKDWPQRLAAAVRRRFLPPTSPEAGNDLASSSRSSTR
jgi:peptidoglycan/LPS O-acetylase OafA/YrhL